MNDTRPITHYNVKVTDDIGRQYYNVGATTLDAAKAASAAKIALTGTPTYEWKPATSPIPGLAKEDVVQALED
jgi:hypothetical protein